MSARLLGLYPKGRALRRIERLAIHGVNYRRYKAQMLALSEAQRCQLAGDSFNGFAFAPLLLGLLVYFPFKWTMGP